MKTECLIYLLKDPISQEIKYIGRTKNDLLTRLSAHLLETSNTKKHIWISELKKRNLVPIIELIEVVDVMDTLKREIYWINFYLNQGCELFNSKRLNTGRKPVDDKKVPFSIYVRQSHINAIGSERIKELWLKRIEAEYTKIILDQYVT